MFRNFFLGFIKIHILHHAAQEPLYSLSPGTVYPILHALTEAGYLVQQDRVVGGKVRKYYSITKTGQRALDQSRRQIVELVREVVDQQPAPAPGRLRTASSRRAERTAVTRRRRPV